MSTPMTLLASDVNGGVAYTFDHNPASIERVHPKRFTATEVTYTSQALIDWGYHAVEEGLIGQTYVLKWPMLRTSTQWAKFVSYYETSQTVTWDPKEKARAPGETYEVIVSRLDGNDLGTTLSYKENVELELMIRRAV